MRHLVVTALLTAVGLGAGGCGSAALQTAKPATHLTPEATTVIYDCAGTPAVRPRALTLYCADAGAFLSGVRWTDWGTATAHGSGVVVENTCRPDCAAGHVVRRHAQLRASGLSLTGTSASYSLLTVAASAGPVSREYTYSSYSLTINGPVPK